MGRPGLESGAMDYEYFSVIINAWLVRSSISDRQKDSLVSLRLFGPTATASDDPRPRQTVNPEPLIASPFSDNFYD